MASMRERARQIARQQQLGYCAICGVAIALCRDDNCRDLHLDTTISQRMPRFHLNWSSGHAKRMNCDRLHRGNPHAALVKINGKLRAGHVSCVSSFQTMTTRNSLPVDQQSAIARLRGRAGYSVTCRLRISPVDNPQKAQLESATRGPRKAQPGSYTTPERLHSVEQQSLGTQVRDQLARARTCPICDSPAPATMHHPYTMPCGCDLTIEQLFNMWGYGRP